MAGVVRADSMIGRLEGWVRLVLYPGVRLILWLLFYLSLLLGGWVALGMVVGGWSPVVVTSGSMEPAVSVGDVLLVERMPGNDVSQRSIVVFERSDGTVVAHRVFSVEGDQLVTKGDANPTPDTERVALTDVDGVARVLVPIIGLPAVWFERGDSVPLVAAAILWLAGSVHFVATVVGAVTRRRSRQEPSERVTTDAGQVGIRRVRILVGVLIAAQFVLDPSRFEVFGETDGRVPLLLGLLAALAATNAASTLLRSPSWQRRLPSLELTADTLLVVFLSALTGSAGLGWVLFALPIIEAAVRFGLVGALTHWMVLTTLAISTRVWSFEVSASFELLEELEQTLDQMSVLFLVVVPGAYLAEQLVADAADQRRAVGRVVARSDLLERVAKASRSVSQLGGDPVSETVDGTRSLGFDVVDLVAMTPTGWKKIGGEDQWDLPHPGDSGSGLRPEDLIHNALRIDGDSDAERESLDAFGLAVVITAVVAVTEVGRAVLRAGLRSGRVLDEGQIDAFQLLAGQANVALQNHELLSEITSIHGELEHRAHHDALTGLPNRVLLLERLDDALGSGERPALMFLDLDGFKPVNDRLGHDAGDSLLQQVSNRLQRAAPAGSTVARVGGDEFTVLLTGEVTAAEAENVARRITDSISQPFVVNEDHVRVGASIGISFGDASVGSSEIVRQADVAMYVAKHGDGEQRFEFYRSEFDLAEERRAALALHVGGAIADRSIKVVYQPVFESNGGQKLAGIEALVRWTHPALGVIPPPEIVTAAQQAGEAGVLHRHITFEAMRNFGRWVERGDREDLFLSINASPIDLTSTYLVSNLADAATACGVEPEHVFVEISEQLVAPDIPAVMRNIADLNANGFSMLLDDFGEGQTALSYIHELPVAGIKLDRKLVVNAVRSRTDRIVIESIVDLCSRLGLLVIAEGIENEEHLAIVEEVGCNLVQGFFLARPGGAETLDAAFDAVATRLADPLVIEGAT